MWWIYIIIVTVVFCILILCFKKPAAPVKRIVEYTDRTNDYLSDKYHVNNPKIDCMNPFQTQNNIVSNIIVTIM